MPGIGCSRCTSRTCLTPDGIFHQRPVYLHCISYGRKRLAIPSPLHHRSTIRAWQARPFSVRVPEVIARPSPSAGATPTLLYRELLPRASSGARRRRGELDGRRGRGMARADEMSKRERDSLSWFTSHEPTHVRCRCSSADDREARRATSAPAEKIGRASCRERVS